MFRPINFSAHNSPNRTAPWYLENACIMLLYKSVDLLLIPTIVIRFDEVWFQNKMGVMTF
jgi:hypothetical protein